MGLPGLVSTYMFPRRYDSPHENCVFGSKFAHLAAAGYVLALSWIPMEQTACRTMTNRDLPGGVSLIRVVFLQNGV